MKKKWLAALAAVVLAAGFAACSNGDADGDGEKDLSQTTEVFSVKYDVAGLADVKMKDNSKGANIQKKQGETVTADELWVVTVKDAYKGSYTFGGWHMDAECTKPFAAFEVTKHTTLYAKFTANDGTAAAIKVVKYVTEKGYMDAKRTVAGTLPPSYLGCPPTSFEGGMYFAGWFTDEARTDRAEPGAAIGESGMTLYAKWTELLPGASAAFEGIGLAGIGGLYERSADKDSGTGEYTYTPLSEPGKKKEYYLITGVSEIGGALVFSKTMGNVSVRSDSNDGSTAAELRLGNSLNSSNVTLVENLASYVCVRPTGAGTVTATLSNVPSSSVTGTSTAKALLIDGNGKVIAQAAIDNKQGTKTEPVTLSCTVTNAAPVYLAFGRYDDKGGQLGVKKITFTPSTPTAPGTIDYDPAEWEIEGTKVDKYKGNKTEVSIPNGVTRIGETAFDSLSNLTSVIIPDSVTRISKYAFYRCSSLTDVVIPRSVTRISSNAFYECENLTSVKYDGTKGQWEAIDGLDENDWSGVTIYCTDGKILMVAKLPASVGAEPFTTGIYTALTGVSGSWWICFGKGKNQEVGGTLIEIDTAKKSITLLSYDKDDGHEETDALLKYAYDSNKKEICLALSKLGYEKKDDDDTSYLWTRDEIVSYLQSIVGQTFDDKGDAYTYTQEDFEEDKAELDESFDVVVTYGYEKSESGSITLTLKEPIIYEDDNTVTLTGVQYTDHP